MTAGDGHGPGRGSGEAAGNAANDNAARGGPKAPLRDVLRPLPRRFYTSVAVVGVEGGHGIALDGRPVRTPGKSLLVVPSMALADALAAEWTAQGASIDPATMPLTRIVNSAIDGVAPRRAEVAADIAAYSGSDLVCYRADAPPALVAAQARVWDPVLAWARDALGADFVVASGVMPVTQPAAANDRIAAAIAGLDALTLASLHVMTTLTGSALIALAHLKGHMGPKEAWAAAHVDEDWQASQWGEDAEAVERRRRRWQEMEAASRLLALAAVG